VSYTYVALELDIVLSSSVDLYLKEYKIVAKYLKGGIDIRQPLSNNGDDVVQTSRRSGRPIKGFKMSFRKK